MLLHAVIQGSRLPASWEANTSTSWITEEKETDGDLARMLLQVMLGLAVHHFCPHPIVRNQLYGPTLTGHKSQECRGVHEPMGKYHYLGYICTNDMFRTFHMFRKMQDKVQNP